MKLLYSLKYVLIFAIITLASCSREDIDDVIVDEPNYTPDTLVINNLMNNLKSNTNDGMDLGCVTIEFPFELLTESQGTVTIASESEFEQALEMQGADRVIDFVYPLDIIENDGSETVVQAGAELAVLFASCIPETGWTNTASGLELLPASLFEDFCFDIQYPVELVDPEGNTLIAEDETEFIDELASAGELFFSLPVSFVDEDGDEVIVQNIDDFYELVFECEGISAPVVGDGFEIDEFSCFELTYPFDVEREDGSTVTIENENDYANLVLNGEIVYITLPFTVEFEDGSTSVVSNEEDLILILIDCGIIIEVIDPNPCEVTETHVLLFYNALNIFTLNRYPFEISYPVTLIVEGNPVVINSGNEYIPAVGNNPSRIIPAEIVYPVTITQFGQEIVLNSDDDVCAFYNTLIEPCENKPAHIQFFFNEGGGVPINCAYFIEYPVEITRNGNSIEIQTRDEYLTELNTTGAYDEIELVYPVAAFKFSDNQQVTFDSDSDICDYLNDCF